MPLSRRKILACLVAGPLAAGLTAVRGFADTSRSGLIQKVAFGACAFQWAEQPIWNSVNGVNPDLFLFLGDAIYGDFDGKEVFEITRESLQRDWNRLGAKPGFSKLRNTTPVLATWDNHDYGHHNGGVEFKSKQLARDLFLDFFAVPPDSPRRTRDGIYHAQVFGIEGQQAQVILLDNRWNRSPIIADTRSEDERKSLGLSGSMGHIPDTDPAATLLGELQWRWLEAQLQKPADIRLICSGTQVVNDAKGMQEWGNFPHERNRLIELIAHTRAQGVILLSGNVHYSEVSRFDEGPYPLYDFTSSGVTHNSTAYAEYKNPYRVAGPYAGNNFGLVEIDWLAKPAPTVTLKTVDLGGDNVFIYNISLAALK